MCQAIYSNIYEYARAFARYTATCSSPRNYIERLIARLTFATMSPRSAPPLSWALDIFPISRNRDIARNWKPGEGEKKYQGAPSMLRKCEECGAPRFTSSALELDFHCPHFGRVFILPSKNRKFPNSNPRNNPAIKRPLGFEMIIPRDNANFARSHFPTF